MIYYLYLNLSFTPSIPINGLCLILDGYYYKNVLIRYLRISNLELNVGVQTHDQSFAIEQKIIDKYLQKTSI